MEDTCYYLSIFCRKIFFW